MRHMTEQLCWKNEHQNLNLIIDTMQSQSYLSADELRVLKDLKKQRLYAKDKSTQQS